MNSPTEVLRIDPESLTIANTYLETQNIQKTAELLGVAPDIVSNYLDRREVRAYIDNVFQDMGFSNRFKMRALMDAIIEKKLEEMQEADIGSSKDIIEIMTLSHKMAIELMDRQIKLEQIKQTNIKNQVNVQINDGGSNYQALLEKLTSKK